MFEVVPLRDRVIVKIQKPEEKTSSGIILTGEAKEKPIWGSVVAVGPGTKDEEMTLKVGDTVIYPSTGGDKVKLDGEDYTIFKQEEILAVARVKEEESDTEEETKEN